jgi:hypothetical protein|tara:strand:+ start:987 stop:1727 length:741 start_codon:yes stop_codon:yes gene_type:complete
MDVFVKEGEEYKALSSEYQVLSQSDLDTRYVSKSKHSEDIESAIASRFKNHLNKDKAHEDPTVIARVLEGHDVGDKVDLDKQRTQWAAANLDPVKADLEEVRTQLGRIVEKQKYSQMKESFKLEFNDLFVERLDPDKPSLAEIHLGERLEFDLNTSSLKVKDSAMAITDFAKELAKDPRYVSYLRPPDKNLSGHGKPGQAGGSPHGGSGASSFSRKEEIENHSEYITKYGMSKRKVEGTPSYNELK